MATSQLSEVIQHLRRAVLLADGAEMTDGQLLERFISERDQAALTALVRRHSPMVWGVCRRVLRDHHDAEDAYQATFLVLVRRATAVMPRDMVANWLYGVACQTARKAGAVAAQRKRRERQVPEMPDPLIEEQELWRDLQPLLDQELLRLPDKYRVAIVLCDLEGKTRKEAARQVGVPEGTLSGRLARGRAMLAKRLSQRGVSLSAGALGAMLWQASASAAVPTSVASAALASALQLAAGQATAGVISAKAATLAEGVVRAMFLTRLKIASVVFLALAVLGAGIGIVATQISAAQGADTDLRALAPLPGPGRAPDGHQVKQTPDHQTVLKIDSQPSRTEDTPKSDNKVVAKNPMKDDDDDDDDEFEGVVKSLDVSKGAITMTIDRKGQFVDRTFELKKNVRVQVGGKASTLSEVKAGMRIVVELSKSNKVVEIRKAKG